MKSVVTKFLVKKLDVPYPNLAQAFCIGTLGIPSCAIIVKFNDQTQRDMALASKAVLKGHKIWLDFDLIALQVATSRK